MNHILAVAAILFFMLCATNLWAADPADSPRMPAIFGDNMVLQSGMPAPVWGWATPGQKVTVKIAAQEKTAQADASGKWRVKLDPLKAGDALEMTVEFADSPSQEHGDKQPRHATLTFKNILAGEVWLCSGQSNMGTGVGSSINGMKEFSEANFPKIRIFQVPMRASPDKPAEDIGAPWGCFRGKWLVCSPETIGAFPAVGYYFAKKVHQELGTPMGMIESVWGGTGQEAWLSREGFQSDPLYKPLLKETDDWLAKDFPKAKAKHEAEMAAYDKEMDAWEKDHMEADDKGWDAAGLDESAWKEIALPGPAKMNGVAWFRRTVQLPADWVGKDLKISLGNVVDNDVTYINGVKVGGVNDWDAPREYDVPAALVKDGRAVIAVRAEGFGGGTGPAGQLAQMTLALNVAQNVASRYTSGPSAVAPPKPLSLAGAWKFRVAVSRPVLPVATDFGNPPGSVYNGMIAPLAGLGIRGVLWYQGEGSGFEYHKLFPAMIRDWRKQWGQGDFPFLYVQLPNLSAGGNAAVEESWVNVREVQLQTLAVPNTGMAVTIDVGDVNNVHYANKQPVGLRLALWALAKVYHKDIVYSGPLYESAQVEGNKIRVKFHHVGGGLIVGCHASVCGSMSATAEPTEPSESATSSAHASGIQQQRQKHGTQLQTFLIAGADRKFVPAEAVIDGDSVLVWSDKVAEPVAVRYAWRCNPEGCNLYNKEGLPASPFRTDGWPWKKP
jgi:sialate O-acetylesterase